MFDRTGNTMVQLLIVTISTINNKVHDSFTLNSDNKISTTFKIDRIILHIGGIILLTLNNNDNVIN